MKILRTSYWDALWWTYLRAVWQPFVVRVDRLLGRTHARCPGCGSMDEDLDDPACVAYEVSHHPVEVDRYGFVIEARKVEKLTRGRGRG